MTITDRPSESHFKPPIASISEPARRVRDLKAACAAWRKRRGYRRDLQRLLRVGPHMLADIGLTLEEARREIVKPFWRA